MLQKSKKSPKGIGKALIKNLKPKGLEKIIRAKARTRKNAAQENEGNDDKSNKSETLYFAKYKFSEI